MSPVRRSRPAGVYPAGKPARTLPFEHFIPMIGARVLYIEQNSGLKVYRAANSAMTLAVGNNYQEIIVPEDQFARMKDTMKRAARQARKRQ